MSWIAGTILNARQQRLDRRAAALAPYEFPEHVYPVLGLGGHSIELSVAASMPVSVDAVALAVSTLHKAVSEQPAIYEGAEKHRGDLRAAAEFLAGISVNVDIPRDVLNTLNSDRALLRG